jgi:hypothetical protein
VQDRARIRVHLEVLEQLEALVDLASVDLAQVRSQEAILVCLEQLHESALQSQLLNVLYLIWIGWKVEPVVCLRKFADHPLLVHKAREEVCINTSTHLVVATLDLVQEDLHLRPIHIQCHTLGQDGVQMRVQVRVG